MSPNTQTFESLGHGKGPTPPSWIQSPPMTKGGGKAVWGSRGILARGNAGAPHKIILFISVDKLRQDV